MNKIFSAILLTFYGLLVTGFPDGAPADTCVKKRANQPNHGQARSQKLETLPFQVVATSDSYQPGQQIHGIAIKNIRKLKTITDFINSSHLSFGWAQGL